MPLLDFFTKPLGFDDEERCICVAHKCPSSIVHNHESYSNNKIITSKYTAWNFLFKNLFEQFRRIANFYFLCIAIIQLSINSPVSPATSLLPLIFVVTVTAFKQAYEDWLRHRADKIMNQKRATVVQHGKLHSVKCEDLKVGDVIKVYNNCESPCDLVLLSSSHADGHCHVMTANLDGETNLKNQKCLEHTMSYRTVERLQELCAQIECNPPSPDLYYFVGKLTIFPTEGEPVVGSLSSKNLLLKGAALKNTDFVFGCAVYTGPDTKLFLNLKLTSNKFSTVEKSLNNFLIIFLIVLLIKATLGSVLMFTYDHHPYLGHAWYIPLESKVAAGDVISDFLSLVILFNYIIPISLYVTLDLIKFIGALFFIWDLDMYDSENDEPAVCNSSDLNEELGQVEYLFSDKTGTLTENRMVFQQCSINGVKFEEKNGALCALDGVTVDQDSMKNFIMVLLLCNTVQIVENSGLDGNVPEYFASSPDEKALVEACARLGHVLMDINDNEYKVSIDGKVEVYKRLCTMEFDSERKRMSVIVENESGDIYLLCKGADSTVMNNIIFGKKTETEQHINSYTMAGFRILAIAMKYLSPAEYQNFKNELHAASCLMKNRDKVVELLYNNMEQNLLLLGVTAVEDRLQEKVSDTIQSLRVAGIKVWVLTGDHPDTALNISYACSHIHRNMVKLELFCQDSNECFYALRRLECRITEDLTRSYFLIADGRSISFALENSPNLLRLVAEQCIAVLCCRMSPLQKSQVVKLMKCSDTKPVTAAIGDGANDVSMIQEAHVGIGIIGHEGRHAVRCSDFAFSKFCYLKKALLVHGHYYYVRSATLVQYFFYKNVAFILPQFIYLFYNGYTPQPLYNSVYLMTFNIFFASLPIFIFGFTEKHCTEQELMCLPYKYRKISKNQYLTYAQFAKWMITGFWHAIVIFFGVYLLWGDSPVTPEHGLTLGMLSFGTALFPIVVVVVNFKLALHTRYWTYMFTMGLVLSIIGYIVFFALYTQVHWSVNTSLLYGVYAMVLSTVQVWLASVLLIVTALLPDVVLVLLDRHNISLLKVVHRVCYSNYRTYRFRFRKSKNDPDITMSQINICNSSSDYAA